MIRSTIARLGVFTGLCLFIVLTNVQAQSSPNLSSALYQQAIVDMEGGNHQLAEISEQGDSIALIFWQTWCSSCKAELPGISKIAKDSKLRMKFFGVISGPDEFVDDNKVRSYLREQTLSFPQIRDREASISNTFGVKGTPTIVILGRNGEVLYNEHHTPSDWGQFSGQ
jgi:thiol-disulfide isomerase/thioredoxin